MPTDQPVPGPGAEETQPADEDCSLDRREQTRNLLLFAGCTGLIFLCAPVLYVGVTQASLCRRLRASDTVSNLPATVFFAMTVAPVLVAWYWPQVARLKRNLATCFLASAGSLTVVAAALML